MVVYNKNAALDISRTIHVYSTRDLVGDLESKTGKKIEYK